MSEIIEEGAFTSEVMAEAQDYDVLGPAYFAARATAERFMASFQAEHFKPLIDEFAKELNYKLWSDLEASLLSDTESNLHTSMWRMVDNVINALLAGEEWAIKRYPLAEARYGDAPKIRAAILAHAAPEIVGVRIAELEAENASLRADVERFRGRY